LMAISKIIPEYIVSRDIHGGGTQFEHTSSVVDRPLS
jgi:hypothetical protein